MATGHLSYPNLLNLTLLKKEYMVNHGILLIDLPQIPLLPKLMNPIFEAQRTGKISYISNYLDKLFLLLANRFY